MPSKPLPDSLQDSGIFLFLNFSFRHIRTHSALSRSRNNSQYHTQLRVLSEVTHHRHAQRLPGHQSAHTLLLAYKKLLDDIAMDVEAAERENTTKTFRFVELSSSSTSISQNGDVSRMENLHFVLENGNV